MYQQTLPMPFRPPQWPKILPILNYIHKENNISWSAVLTALKDIISVSMAIRPADLSALEDFSRTCRGTRELEICKLSAGWAANAGLDLRDARPIALLGQRGENSVEMSKNQARSILSLMFWCVFPSERGGNTSKDHNFYRVFKRTKPQQVVKIACIFSYFEQARKSDDSMLQFIRISERLGPATATLCPVSTSPTYPSLIVDFANAYYGGGVLGNGCAQEEILLLSYFEPIVGLLFIEKLEDNDVIYVSGIRVVNKCTGYADSFRFEGPEIRRFEGNVLVAMDATDYKNRENQQYSRSAIDRELMKATIAFKQRRWQESLPVLTGNWGCGAFKGNPQLKFLIQWIAASTTHRELHFLPYSNPALRDLQAILTAFRGLSTDILLKCLYDYEREGRGMQVFEHCLRAVKHSEAAYPRQSPQPGLSSSHQPHPKPPQYSFVGLGSSYAGAAGSSSPPNRSIPSSNTAVSRLSALSMPPAGVPSQRFSQPLNRGKSIPPIPFHNR